MSAEKAQIESVKNNIVRVGLPDLEGAPTTYITGVGPNSSDVSLTVKDNTGFTDDDYLIIGEVGQERTEIVRINDTVTAGTSITITALTFDHPSQTKVTLIRYDQVELYGSSTADDGSPTIIGSAATIDVANGFNELVATTTYDYYYARYKNSNDTVYSQYSSSVSASGLSDRTRGEIKKEFLSIYNERKDRLISEDWLNRAVNRWQRELQKRKPTWSILRGDSTQDLTEDTQRYSLPTDINITHTADSIISVKIADEPELNYMDDELFTRATYDHIGSEVSTAFTGGGATLVIDDSSDFAEPTGSDTATIHVEGETATYTTNTTSTGTLTGVSDLDNNHSVDVEVWQTYTTGQPRGYTVEDGEIKLYPIPNSAWAGKNLYIEYWKDFPALDDDADETLFLYPTSCYLYLHWQAAIRRKLDQQEIQTRRAEFLNDLEYLVSEDGDARDIRIAPLNLYPGNARLAGAGSKYTDDED